MTNPIPMRTTSDVLRLALDALENVHSLAVMDETVGFISPEAPLTRSLPLTLDALEVSEAELSHQITRLHEVLARKAIIDHHLADLLAGYTLARRYLRILINYHAGRLERRAS